MPNDGQKQVWRIVHDFVRDGVSVELTREEER